VIRLVLRLLATFLLAGAVAVGVIDATSSFERETLVLTPFEQAVGVLMPSQPGGLEAFVKGHGPGLLWDPVSLTLLRLPAILVLATLAAILFRLARRRPRKPGFATY